MQKKHSSKFLTLVDEVKKKIKETDVKTVHEMIQNKESFSLIDVREDEEWSNGHLPKAIHLSKGIIERDIEKLVTDSNAKIVLYCGGGFRSALAALNLQKMGYHNVISMDGGYTDWLNHNYDIEGN